MGDCFEKPEKAEIINDVINDVIVASLFPVS